VPVRNANLVCIYLIPARRTLFFGSWVLAVYTALEPTAAPHPTSARLVQKDSVGTQPLPCR